MNKKDFINDWFQQTYNSDKFFKRAMDYAIKTNGMDVNEFLRDPYKHIYNSKGQHKYKNIEKIFENYVNIQAAKGEKYLKVKT